MSDLIATLRAIVRDELARVRPPDLGTVTQVFPMADSGGADNHQVNIKLRSSGLELQRVPVAVARLGLSMLPREGDLMVVAYVGGDLNAPVALGSLYDDQARPPQADAAEVVYTPPDDGDSSVRRLYVELPSGAKLTLDDDTVKIELGDTQVIVNRDGDVSISAKGDLKLEAQGDIKLDAQGDIKLTAQQDVSVSGLSAKIEGQSDAKVSGPQVTLAGMTQFSAS